MEGEERSQDEHDRRGSSEGAAEEAGVKENPEGLNYSVLMRGSQDSRGSGYGNTEYVGEHGSRYLLLLPTTPRSAAEPQAFPLTSDRTRTFT